MANWYDIKAAKSKKHAELYVYGPIVSDAWFDEDVTAKGFIDDLNALDVDTLDVRLNCEGGNVFQGIPIYSAIKRHKAKVTTYNDGLAASMGGILQMAGDEIVAGDLSFLMIHNPWTLMLGDANDLRKEADLLDSIGGQMIKAYQTKVAMSDDELREAMDLETWYPADEQVALGFADRVESIAAVAASFDLKRFDRVPGALLALLNDKTQVGEAKAQADPDQVGEDGEDASVTDPEKTDDPATDGDAVDNDLQPDDVEPGAANSDNPADVADTSTRQEEQPMPVENKAAGTPGENDVKAAVNAALAADRERRANIAAKFERFPQYAELRAKCQDDGGCTASMAAERLLAAIGEGASPQGGVTRIETGESATEKFAKGMAANLYGRVGMEKDDGANSYRGHTLLMLASESLKLRNVDVSGMNKQAIVSAAFTHTSSDFSNVLADVANKSMLQGWEEQVETYPLWTRPGTLSDFKAAKRVDTNLFPSLENVSDGGEYTEGTMGDRGETIQLATYGRLFSITRQTIINDDQDAFTRIPQKMGRAARRTVGNLVYAVLTANGNMSDGVALFHASHNNLLTSGVISTSTVDAMRSAMALQKDPQSYASGGLNIPMNYLIVPIALQGLAGVVRDSQFEVGSTSSTKANTIPNSVRETFEVVADARLDSDSATAWYGAASPTMHDTIEVAYLDGDDTPFLDQQEGWNIDGTSFKVRIDAGVKALDFRGLAKNAGA